MYKVTYEPEAEQDLENILLYYIEKGGFDLAEGINKRIKTHIKRLENMPSRVPDSPLVAGTKSFLIEKLPYWAYFEIDEDLKIVRILNIIHTKRSYP